jgi:hypothetical protein
MATKTRSISPTGNQGGVGWRGKSKPKD